jgi:inorganic triphosphatase YgiF
MSPKLSNVETLRPGFLISLKTSVRGNVKYDKRDLGTATTEDGVAIAEWETKRMIADPAEFKAAGEARAKARSLVNAVCVNSAFGLLCPEAAQAELDAAIKAAHGVVDTFNATASITRVSVYAMVGKIAADDVEAVKAINSEVADLLGQMQDGLKNLDVKSIRDAANKAKSIGQMLTPDAAVRIQMAIDAARSSARKIVQAGETAAAEIDLRAIRKVTEARTAFLDMDEAKDVAAPKHQAPALDLAPKGQGDYELTYDGKGNFAATQVTRRKLDI